MKIPISILNLCGVFIFVFLSSPFIIPEISLTIQQITCIKSILICFAICQLLSKHLFVTYKVVLLLVGVLIWSTAQFTLNSESLNVFFSDFLTIIYFFCFYLLCERSAELRTKLVNIWFFLIVGFMILSIIGSLLFKFIPGIYHWSGEGGYDTVHCSLLGSIHVSSENSRLSWYFAEPSYFGFFLGFNMLVITKYGKEIYGKKYKLLLLLALLLCILVSSNTLYVTLFITLFFCSIQKLGWFSMKKIQLFLIISVFMALLIFPNTDLYNVYQQYEQVAESSLADRQSRLQISSSLFHDLSIRDYFWGIGGEQIGNLYGKGESNAFYKMFIEYGSLSILLHILFIYKFLSCNMYAFVFAIVGLNAVIIHLTPMFILNILVLHFLFSDRNKFVLMKK